MLVSVGPSLALNVNASGPTYPVAGVYVRLGAAPESVPFVGEETTVYVSGDPIDDSAFSVMFTGAWRVVTTWFKATGTVPAGWTATTDVCHGVALENWKWAA